MKLVLAEISAWIRRKDKAKGKTEKAKGKAQRAKVGKVKSPETTRSWWIFTFENFAFCLLRFAFCLFVVVPILRCFDYPAQARSSEVGPGAEDRAQALPQPGAVSAAPSGLEPLARAYAEDPGPETQRRLLAFARSHAKQESGALAYLALGYHALEVEDFSSAAEWLRAARAVPTPVSDYAEYYYGAAAERFEDHAGAIEALSNFENKFPASALKSRAAYILASSLLSANRAAETVSLLQKKLDSLPRPGADLLLAHAYQAEGKAREAGLAFSRIYYYYPATVEAEEATRHLREFPKPKPDELRARVEGLQAAARHGGERLWLAAEEAYREWIAAASGAEKERAQVASARFLYRAGRTEAARELLESLKPSDPEAAAERLYWLGECFRRLGRLEDFSAQGRLLGERYPSSSWYEQALFSEGNVALLREGPAAAAHYYAALYERFPQGPYAARAHWRVAWTRYTQDKFEDARRLMAEQLDKYASGPQVPAALYWLGRIAERLASLVTPAALSSAPGAPPQALHGSDHPAEAYFRKLVEDFPLTFYAGQARRLLKSPEARAAPSSVDQLPPRSNEVVRQQKVAALRSAWLLDLAALELHYAADQDAAHQRYWFLELARLERDRQRYQASMEYARRAFPNYLSYRLDQLGREVWELLFPLPWWSAIRAQASARGLDPYLVAGLIRQESAFNAQAVSSARAAGLMQLLPSVGRRMARKTGIRRYNSGVLFNPESNIRMGTLYFKEVLEHFNGHVEETLAAYNAGVDRVEVWRAANYREPAEFVESIPFTETREYVQTVIRNAAIYRQLYGK